MSAAATSPDRVAEILSRVPIFSHLNRRDLKKLAKLCVPRHFAAGDTVIEEGAIGLGMFLVTAGRVEVFKSKNGDRISLGFMQRDDILGEVALVDDQPRSASAVAVEPTDCFLLTKDSFDTLVKKEPEIAWCIVPGLGERIRELHHRALDAEDKLKEAEMAQKKTAKKAAPEPEVEAEAEDEESSEWSDAMMRMFRMQYGLMMGGVAGMTGMARAFEKFFDALGEETELRDCDSARDVFEKLPDGMVEATRCAISEMEDLPQRMIDRFKHYSKAS